MKQTSFLPSLKQSLRMEHGGDVRKGKRKLARPFSHRHPVHVVLRSHRAKGRLSMLTPRNQVRVNRLLKEFSRTYRVRIYSQANVGNHLHLLLKTEAHDHQKAKADFQAFLRRLAGAIAFQILGAKKGHSTGPFWEKLAYSRIVTWGREFDALKHYLLENLFEAAGLLKRKAGRNDRIISLRQLIETAIVPPDN